VVPNSYFKPFFKECHRVLRNPAHLYVMCDEETSYIIRQDIEEAGFTYRKKIIWRKVGAEEPVLCPHCGLEATTRRRAGQPGMGYPYRSSYEVVLLAQKGKRKPPENRSVRDFIDVMDWVDWLPDVHEEQRIKPTKHGAPVYPTQKPLSLLRTFILQSSNLGDLVLDPFAGSGSTLVAAALEGRDYLGFDVLEKAREFCAAREEWVECGEAKRPEAVVGGRSESDILNLFGG
jgi:site-specific DNA-methyltransferase (adenine-specific)